jgi:hypothetical protein
MESLKSSWGFLLDLVLTLGIGLYGFILIAPFLYRTEGLFVAILGCILFPISFIVVPAIIFYTTGNYVPALIIYLGSIIVVKGRKIWGQWN